MPPDACVVHHGDCLDVLRGMPEASVDAVVTDPPYGLSNHEPAEVAACLTAWLAGEEYRPKAKGGFMNRAWDAWVPGPEVWREVARVLRPGGHLCVFAGTRSMDLMSMALRLAGFELRDSIGSMSDGGGAPLLAWVTGQGFPKSLDVGKAIDRMRDDYPAIRQVVEFLRTAAAQKSENAASIASALGWGEAVVGHFLKPSRSNAACPSWEQWLALKALLSFGNEMDAEVWRLNGRKGLPGDAWHEREVVGSYAVTREFKGRSYVGDPSHASRVNVTAPATDAAKQWQGFGTALKPSWEPIVLARKPLAEPTVAANVLRHGTGAINVDACRVGIDESERGVIDGRSGSDHDGRTIYGSGITRPEGERFKSHAAGRWPANLVHDSSPEVLDAFAAFGERKVGNPNKISGGSGGIWSEGSGKPAGPAYADTGTAARFFYSAKASKTERAGSKHPTVKPVALMRWLCRLITPPGGTVLDCFAGSGTTGEAALAEGFSAILIEREAEYYNDILARLARLRDETPLFAEAHAA